jgi:hypothetical protein
MLGEHLASLMEKWEDGRFDSWRQDSWLQSSRGLLVVHSISLSKCYFITT